MIATITNKENAKQFTHAINVGSAASTKKVLKAEYRKMWRYCCMSRDRYTNAKGDEELRACHFSAHTDIDTDLTGLAASLQIQNQNLIRCVVNMLNAYVPKALGDVVLDELFELLPFAYATGMTLKGKMQMMSPNHIGIYSTIPYTTKDFEDHSFGVLANTAATYNYDKVMYAEVCKFVLSCDADHRPVVWLNPIIMDAMMKLWTPDVCGTTTEPKDAMSSSALQAYSSSFINLSACLMGAGETFDELTILQYWETMEGIITSQSDIAFSVVIAESNIALSNRA